MSEKVADDDQIQRDINRTFPEVQFFYKDGEGVSQIYKLLVNLCKKDKRRGYLQGMNFIAATLLAHSD